MTDKIIQFSRTSLRYSSGCLEDHLTCTRYCLNGLLCSGVFVICSEAGMSEVLPFPLVITSGGKALFYICNPLPTPISLIRINDLMSLG